MNLKAKNFKRSELLEKYIVRILFGWDNNKFENKFKRNWIRWKGKEIEEGKAIFSRGKILRERYYYNILGY